MYYVLDIFQICFFSMFYFTANFRLEIYDTKCLLGSQ
jgi:hypothetical protein